MQVLVGILFVYTVILNMMLAEYIYQNNPIEGYHITAPEREARPPLRQDTVGSRSKTSAVSTVQHDVMLVILVHPAAHTHNDMRRHAAIRLSGQIRATPWTAKHTPRLRLFLGPDEPLLAMYRESCRKLPPALDCDVVSTDVLTPAAVMEYMIPYTADGIGLLLLDDSMQLQSNFVSRLRALAPASVTCLLWHSANSTLCPGIAFHVPAPLIDRFLRAQTARDVSALAVQEGVYSGSVPLVRELR